MALKLGIHSGPQNLTMEELDRLWRRADAAGFHWISVWDHFYANPLTSRDNPCFEGVAAMAALAAMTTRVRVGCLVFCALFRTPGVLAKAAATIDHISGGRAEIGIGAGWFQEEFHDFGYDFPPLGKRLDQLEEALTIVRSLWRDPSTTFAGKYYRVEGAVCSPKPKNPRMRLWVGGQGVTRTPRIAARFADGFNLPYLSPGAVKERLERLASECDERKRDPDELDTSVNLHFRMSVDSAAAARAEPLHPRIAEGALVGSPQQVIDRLGEYAATGIKGVNVAFRPPIDWDAFETYIERVLPSSV
jgi:F420-dependent oxidoreductase-like protein